MDAYVVDELNKLSSVQLKVMLARSKNTGVCVHNSNGVKMLIKPELVREVLKSIEEA